MIPNRKALLARCTLIVALAAAALQAVGFATSRDALVLLRAAQAEPAGAVEALLAYTVESSVGAGAAGALALWHPVAGGVLAVSLDSGGRFTELAVDPETGERILLPGKTQTLITLHAFVLGLFAVGVAYALAQHVNASEAYADTPRGRLMGLGLSFVVVTLATALLGAGAPSVFGGLAAGTLWRATRVQAPAPLYTGV